MELLERIKKLCNNEQITFNFLEKQCGLSRQTIEKWDKSIPKISAIMKIANYFNVSTDYLLTGKDFSGAIIEPKVNQILFEALNPVNKANAEGYMRGLLNKQNIDAEKLLEKYGIK